METFKSCLMLVVIFIIILATVQGLFWAGNKLSYNFCKVVYGTDTLVTYASGTTTFTIIKED